MPVNDPTNRSRRESLAGRGRAGTAGSRIDTLRWAWRSPHFDPDRVDYRVSKAVKDWRQELEASDAAVFLTPESAHNISGILKHVLDWVVGSGELADKPVALFNASPRGICGQASLT